MKDYLSTSKSEVYFLKVIFKVCGFLGIFPLEANSFLRNVHLLYHFIFNLTAIICITFEFIKLSEREDGMEIQDILTYSASSGIFILLILVCTHDLFKKRKAWRLFFNIVENLNADHTIDIKLAEHAIKLCFILLLIFLIHINELWYTRPKNITFTNTMSCFGWISIYLETLGITVIIWKTSNIINSYYSHLCNMIQKTLSDKLLTTTCLTKKLIKIQENLSLLHQAVTHINTAMGKMIFVVLASTFLSILSVVNFILYLILSNTLSQLFAVYISSIIMCTELTVSTQYF